jgi:hypothetical protein
MQNIATEHLDYNPIHGASRQPPRANAGELARPKEPALSAEVPAGPGTLPDSEFVLAALRAATLRARLAASELDTIGLALKRNLVTVEGALAWLHDADLLDHVIYNPIANAH